MKNDVTVLISTVYKYFQDKLPKLIKDDILIIKKLKVKVLVLVWLDGASWEKFKKSFLVLVSLVIKDTDDLEFNLKENTEEKLKTLFSCFVEWINLRAGETVDTIEKLREIMQTELKENMNLVIKKKIKHICIFEFFLFHIFVSAM